MNMFKFESDNLKFRISVYAKDLGICAGSWVYETNLVFYVSSDLQRFVMLLQNVLQLFVRIGYEIRADLARHECHVQELAISSQPPT